VRIVDVIPVEYREDVLVRASAYSSPAAVDVPAIPPGSGEGRTVRVTSFEGAKGLSAQHVFIAGLHDEELPRDPAAVKDLEICKFVVGLTRTRKKVTLIHTRHFGASWLNPSSFISWIDDSRLELMQVSKDYWNRAKEGR
jgi:superfamily I DNA/RNA helicase